MARDRKRAKQRQRRAAQRGAGPSRPQRPAAGDAAEAPAAGPAEPATDDAERLEPPGSEIPDLEHGSAEADIARATIAAGSVDAEGVSDQLDSEVGPGPRDRRAADVEEIDEEEPLDEEADDEDAATVAPRRTRRREADRAAGGNRVLQFLRNCWAELRRVQWPDRRQVAQGTAVVLVFVIIAGAFLGLMDFIWQEVIDFII